MTSTVAGLLAGSGLPLLEARALLAQQLQVARERLVALLGEHQLANARKVESFAEAAALPADAAAFAVLALEQGFESPDLAMIGNGVLAGLVVITAGCGAFGLSSNSASHMRS